MLKIILAHGLCSSEMTAIIARLQERATNPCHSEPHLSAARNARLRLATSPIWRRSHSLRLIMHACESVQWRATKII